MELPKQVQDVVEWFARLPGVGEKTALRQSLIMSAWNHEDLEQFGNSVKQLASLKKCECCGMFAEIDKCSICQSPVRMESKTICVVETITDCLAIERSGQFKGRFHVLGGVLNPLMGIGPDELEMDKMFARFREENVEELILAINPSVEGDATCAYISQTVPDSIQVERIGFGIPMGGSLEYLDSMTITKALENKKRM